MAVTAIIKSRLDADFAPGPMNKAEATASSKTSMIG
jgi:hypothetical protein